MHATTASITGKGKTAMQFAIEEAHKKPHEIRDIIMCMLAKATDGVITLPPGIARRIIKETNFEGQRPFKQWRTEIHAKRIDDGQWVPEFAVYFVQLADGRFWLVDGQHRVVAIGMGERSVRVRVCIIHVDDEAHARRVYSQFDRSESVRSTTEILSSVQIDKRFDLGLEYARRVFIAAGLIENHLELPRAKNNATSIDGRIDCIENWHKEALLFKKDTESATGVHRNRLRSGGTIAVAMLTYRYQPDKAHTFWAGAANNDGLRRGDPRHTLLRDAETRVLRSGSARQAVQAPSIAWNAFFEGRELKVIKCIDGAPIIVLGTPYRKGNAL